MSRTMLIDDVFVGAPTNSKKSTVRQILGSQNVSPRGHQRFYSDRFIPFVSERDIKGRIIKREAQRIQTQKQISLWKICLQNDAQKKYKISKPDSSVDLKFKLHEVNHFRNVSTKSHLQKLPDFRKSLKLIQNKDYEKKRRSIKDQEDFLFTNQCISTTQQNKNEKIKLPRQKQNIKKRVQSLKDLNSFNITDKSNKKNRPQSVLQKLKESRSNSFKNLLKTNHHRNPELQEIERQVKVHFNHPELDRLKQSRKLDLKFLQNIQKGDKKFKQKVEEYRIIKERIKKQMTKL